MYDASQNVMFCWAKGESAMWFAEWMNEGFVVAGRQQFSDGAAKGGFFIPKHGCNVMQGEVARFMKVKPRALVPHAMIFPKKNYDMFHEDIYPDCELGTPSCSQDDYLAGANVPPTIGSLNPANRSQGDGGFVFEAKKSYAELEAENLALQERVAALEAELADLRA